jgi:hypothetical protein
MWQILVTTSDRLPLEMFFGAVRIRAAELMRN